MVFGHGVLTPTLHFRNVMSDSLDAAAWGLGDKNRMDGMRNWETGC